MVKSVRRIAVNLAMVFLLVASAALGYGLVVVFLIEPADLLGWTLYSFLGYFAVTFFAPFAYLLGAEVVLRFVTPDRQRLLAVLGATIIPAVGLQTVAYEWEWEPRHLAFVAYLVAPALVLGLLLRLPPSRSFQPAESEG